MLLGESLSKAENVKLAAATACARCLGVSEGFFDIYNQHSAAFSGNTVIISLN